VCSSTERFWLLTQGLGLELATILPRQNRHIRVIRTEGTEQNHFTITRVSNDDITSRPGRNDETPVS
jgi:hypothetical protein